MLSAGPRDPRCLFTQGGGRAQVQKESHLVTLRSTLPCNCKAETQPCLLTCQDSFPLSCHFELRWTPVAGQATDGRLTVLKHSAPVDWWSSSLPLALGYFHPWTQLPQSLELSTGNSTFPRTEWCLWLKPSLGVGKGEACHTNLDPDSCCFWTCLLPVHQG